MFDHVSAGEAFHRYVYGIDLASKRNYTSVIIHDLPVAGLPLLAGIYKLPHRPYSEYLSFLQDQLYTIFPPFYQVSDYTAEKSFTDILVRDYGPGNVEGIIFGTASKKMLKDDGLSILKQGYRFPNPGGLDPLTRRLVAELVEQLQYERMELTPSGLETFPKPAGRDNDMAIAWELSIHGCIKHMLNSDPNVAVETDGYNDDGFDEEDPFPELRGKNVTSTDVRYG